MVKYPKVVSIDVVKRESNEPLRKEAIPRIPTKTLPLLSNEVGEDCVPDANSITSARCPHCGAFLTFPGFDSIYAFICKQCGEPVEVHHPVQ
jgi:hypothetical protein